MVRSIKRVGLALVATLVLGATGASAASAAEFHSSIHHTILKGEQTAVSIFTFDAGNLECNNLKYEGTIAKEITEQETTTSTFSVTPLFSNCTATFGLGVSVHHNECRFEYHTNTNTWDVVCPAGKVIEVTAPGCVVTIPGQVGLNGVVFTLAKPHLPIDHSTTNLKYEEHNKGFFPTCKNNTVPTTNGSFSTKVTLEGYDTNSNKREVWYQ